MKRYCRKCGEVQVEAMIPGLTCPRCGEVTTGKPLDAYGHFGLQAGEEWDKKYGRYYEGVK